MRVGQNDKEKDTKKNQRGLNEEQEESYHYLVLDVSGSSSSVAIPFRKSHLVGRNYGNLGNEPRAPLHAIRRPPTPIKIS